MTPEIYMPAVYMVLGGLSTLIGVGVYALVAVPRPRRNGFDVDSDGIDLHRHLSRPQAEPPTGGRRSFDAPPERFQRVRHFV